MSQLSASAPAPQPASDPGGPKKTVSLYADHQKVQPRRISGTFRRLKTRLDWLFLGLYFIGPWIPWPRSGSAPDQAFLLDIADRKGYILGLEIWPQEVYYLTGVLVLGAIGLFFVTALFGRVWCGFACIQTVWTDWFVAVERLIEGDRPARIRLDAAPLGVKKLARKSLKITLWGLIALLTGATFILYFNPAVETALAMLSGQASWGIYGFALLFAGTTFLLAGFAREQVCIYMCPWPRFQSAMFDEHSLIITYEAWRGEPRGGARKGQDFTGRGDCVDCGLCVQVCPTGIDIRDGNQLACIGCGLCIDACNQIMERFGRPPNLIAYDSTANQAARAVGQTRRPRLWRPRTLAYTVLLALVAGVMTFGLTTRSDLEVNLLHERSPLFVRLSDGAIRNGYTLKVLNMAETPRTYALSLDGIPEARLTVVGFADAPTRSVDLPVKADSVGTFRVYVTVPEDALTEARMDLAFVLDNTASQQRTEHDTLFATPLR
ncbi:cytochrome c oxidase accessory protein CcoG [Roseospirillum parvum]|uniref:Cytochrome c oxidase accessory protein FixG n=1 Tax=Roseospirillum parvum TaxID=83401 RepID=A0A1G7WNP8_9PROT|nr:cytochrome c oxidase accessory protein CcoG [Roseospirillum parvum]SDG73615.1 cytochrome c oxidase accessory protein FixG [Roseospirillum parvum]